MASLMRQRDHPRLLPKDYDALVDALKKLTLKAEVHVAKLSSMKKAQQIELMGRAEVSLACGVVEVELMLQQIILGIHSDEIMHALWMQDTPRSTVIEIFEEGGYDRQCFA